MEDSQNPVMGERVIRAKFDENTITVYQAFGKKIAESAVEAQTFVSPPFKMERMTWIKPSFLWMMYRSGWAKKEPGKQILCIKITKRGFEKALKMSCLSTYHSDIHYNKDNWKKLLTNSPVRIQWDPERNLLLEPLPHRAIQIGLSEVAVKMYVNQWIIAIENITEYVHDIHEQVNSGNFEEAKKLLPKENYYSIQNEIEKLVGIKKSSIILP